MGQSTKNKGHNTMDIENEILRLSGAINRLIGSQKTWNDSHDVRSKEILRHIRDEQARTASVVSAIQRKLAGLPCGERKEAIEGSVNVINEQLVSIEKRIKWVWGSYAVSFLAAVTAVAAKVAFK